MASSFDDIDAAAQAVIADLLGDAVTFVGMLDGEYSRGADPLRPQQESRAVTALSPRAGEVIAGIEDASPTGTRRTHTNSEMWLAAADFAALAWPPRPGDRVLIDAGTDTERTFSIMSVMPLDGDVQFLLSEEAVQS